MDQQQEMMQLQELFDVLKGMFDFTGNIMLQYAGGNRYVEQRGVEAMLSHLHAGGHIDTTMIRTGVAQGLEERLKEAHVPYASFEMTTEENEAVRLYTFRDSDRAIVKDIVQRMEIDLPKGRDQEKRMGMPEQPFLFHGDRNRNPEVEPSL